MSNHVEGFPDEEHMPTVTLPEAMRKPPLKNFGRIFQEYYDLVYRTAYSVTRKAEDAEDVAQAVFLRLLRLEVPPDLTKNPKGYFYRAAVNASLRLIRSRSRMVLAGDSEQREASTEAGNSDNDEALDRQLWAAIAELNDRAAQMLILRYVQGHSLAEVAKILGTSSGVVAVSLFRSRARLKKLIRAAEAAGKEEL
jgi:RNA polymerase sigma factor (sigma-70 family)